MIVGSFNIFLMSVQIVQMFDYTLLFLIVVSIWSLIGVMHWFLLNSDFLVDFVFGDYGAEVDQGIINLLFLPLLLVFVRLNYRSG